jgi:hypothetical protein
LPTGLFEFVAITARHANLLKNLLLMMALDKLPEYELLQTLELEMTKLRHTTFTALISVSFLLPGLALQADRANALPAVSLFGSQYTIDKVIFMLGFIFYCFTVFHYWWYHRYSHIYRKRLKDIEEELGFYVYRLRQRKTFTSFIGTHKFHFDWSLYILGGIYGFVACSFVGKRLFLIGIFAALIPYLCFMVNSVRNSAEPLEEMLGTKDHS